MLLLYEFRYLSGRTINLIIIYSVVRMGSDEKEDIDVKDLENGPLTEANRECRDTLCCLLFFLSLCTMVYLGAYGFSMGDPSKIFRPIDQNGNVCGDKTNTNTKDYPYLYFTNPLDSLQKRSCISSCPGWTGSTVSAITCAPYATATICNSDTYNVIYSNDGTLLSGTYASSSILGYDTYLVLDRICIPNSNMFTNAFSTITSSFSSAMNQGAMADFV